MPTFGNLPQRRKLQLLKSIKNNSQKRPIWGLGSINYPLFPHHHGFVCTLSWLKPYTNCNNTKKDYCICGKQLSFGI